MASDRPGYADICVPSMRATSARRTGRSWEAFRLANTGAVAALDERCEEFTDIEREIGRMVPVR